jgi:general secretion pathway protein K
MNARMSNDVTAHTASGGFIVVAVLWILGMLSALAGIYAVFVINTAAGFAVHDDRLRAEGLVSAAIELTAYRQLAAPAGAARGRFSFQLGQANVAVEFQSEAARIDLNAAPKALLVGLFVALGARHEDAEIYGDRIIGWRTQANGQDEEAAPYRAARLGYAPRGGKFPHVNELSLVRDLPKGLVERALPFVTVYSGRPQVNVLDAAPEVIAALPEMTPERLNALLSQRQALPGNAEALLRVLGTAQNHVTTEDSKALRITVRATFESGRQASSEVVILIFDQGDLPFAVLSWQDEFLAKSGNAGLR